MDHMNPFKDWSAYWIYGSFLMMILGALGFIITSNDPIIIYMLSVIFALFAIYLKIGEERKKLAGSKDD